MKEEYPEKYRVYAKWFDMFPGWTHKLWGEKEIRELLMERWPLLIPAYDSSPSPSAKSDIGRYAILAAEGGVYADTDFEPLRDLEWIFAGEDVKEVVSRFYVTSDGALFLGDMEYNTCVIGATSGSRLMLECLEGIRTHGPYDPGQETAHHFAGIVTGPGQISRAVNHLYGPDIKSPDIRVLPHQLLDPLIFNNMHQKCDHESDCRVMFPGSYGIHRMDGSWVPEKKSVDRAGYMYSCANDRWEIIVISLIIFLSVAGLVYYLAR